MFIMSGCSSCVADMLTCRVCISVGVRSVNLFGKIYNHLAHDQQNMFFHP